MDSEYYREMEYLGAEMNAAEFWRELDYYDERYEEPPPTAEELARWREEDAIAAQVERDYETGAYGTDEDDAELARLDGPAVRATMRASNDGGTSYGPASVPVTRIL